MAKKILIVGPAWVGDMVMAQSLAKTLRLQDPDAVIDILAPGWSLPIIERMSEVRRGVELPIGHGELELARLWRLGRNLRSEHYDQAIVLPRKFKAALVPFFAGIPQRTGYRGEFRYWLINDMRPLDKKLLSQTVLRFTALGLPAAPQAPPLQQPALSVDPVSQKAKIAELGLDNTRPAVAFMAGAEYGPAKQWPAQYYGQVAAEMIRSGKQVWVFGAGKEQALGEEIRAAAGNPAEEEGFINLCGRTALADVVDLISACEVAVCNDSGLMHVAAAAGTPLVAIYGSSTPDYTPPLTDKAQVLYLGIECSPCFERTCPLGHYNCLRHIKPESVLQAVRSS